MNISCAVPINLVSVLVENYVEMSADELEIAIRNRIDEVERSGEASAGPR